MAASWGMQGCGADWPDPCSSAGHGESRAQPPPPPGPRSARLPFLGLCPAVTLWAKPLEAAATLGLGACHPSGINSCALAPGGRGSLPQPAALLCQALVRVRCVWRNLVHVDPISLGIHGQ